MNIDKKANQAEFEALLRSVNRDGMDYVIEDLEKDGFFDAPASAGHHLNVPGGLCEHSLNVCRAALKVWEAMCQLDENLGKEVKKENVIVASLLHDVCKTNIYKPTTKRKKNALGVWEDVPGWNVVYNKLPLGHGEKSVIMLLLSGLDLTDEEMMAIRWHMGPSASTSTPMRTSGATTRPRRSRRWSPSCRRATTLPQASWSARRRTLQTSDRRG